ncbi:vitamin K-dependent protein Z [Carlito syrichta]|uniref:Vitamin K-dependent protein Z n=1 Tax=Carlito syrichta TaxID=1868482 RepID=A0A3Q0DJZ8_CARSF|nr:vitamin K-dependent protein Z [Carlito syrichta]
MLVYPLLTREACPLATKPGACPSRGATRVALGTPRSPVAESRGPQDGRAEPQVPRVWPHGRRPLLFHTVFLSASSAHAVLARGRRAGTFLLEELFQGNLEKECFEEVCVYEEAREVFEDGAATEGFWQVYGGGSPCVSQPCLHNGSCQDHIRGFTCTCSPGYEGRTCALAKNECHPERTDGCQHFCLPGQESYTCSCAQGHRLDKDRRGCVPHDPCACGVLPVQRAPAPGRSEQSPPELPWQVKLTNSEGEDFCGGVIIQENFVLTTARCSLLHRNIRVKTSFNRTSEDPRAIGVKRVHVHLWYDQETGDNDVALLELAGPVPCPGAGAPVCTPETDFAEHVLVPRTGGLLSGWVTGGARLGTSLATLPVTHVDGAECGQVLNMTVTTRMSCERGAMAAGHWAEGSVVTRQHGGTWFLTGVVGSQPAGGRTATFLVTKLSRYSLWLRRVLK